MHCSLLILTLVIIHTKGDCLYPEWKITCQKYCMDNQLYEIQLNQCYSQNPDQLTCKCSGQILTDKIKDIIQNKNSLPPTSTLSSTDSSNEMCIPSKSCILGKIICYNQHFYCNCQNGTWIEVLCPEGNICKTENNISSCQSTSRLVEKTLLSSVGSSIMITNYPYIFLYLIFIK